MQGSLSSHGRAGPLYVRVDEESGHGEARVHGEFGVARGRPDSALPAAMRVAEAVPQGPQARDDGRDARQNLLDHLFTVLVRGDLHGSGGGLVEPAQVPVVLVRDAALIADVLARALEQGPRSCDRTFWIRVRGKRGVIETVIVRSATLANEWVDRASAR